MRQVYAYIRVSTVKQGERGSSLQEQRGSIDAYSRRHDLEIAEWFEEKETAAKQGRRVFNHMLRLLDRKKAAGVIIHKIDRSARNLRDWADLGELIDRGVEVHFAHESVDLTSRGGRLSADIQAVVAADYIRNLRDEVKKGFYGRLKQGYYPLPAPLGYRDNGGGQAKTPDPITAPLVRQAFESYATGRYNLPLLNEELYTLGLRNRKGGRVSMHGLSTLLNSEFYIGIIRIERTGEHFIGKHEPLISQRLFEEVQGLLRGRKKVTGVKHDLAYRKTLRCANCGYSLIGEVQKGSAYYRCHTPACRGTSLGENDLVDQVRSALLRIRMSQEDYDDLLFEFGRCDQKSTVNQKETARALKLRIAQVDERVGRLTDAYVNQVIDREIFEERKKILFHERSKLRDTLDQVLSGNDPARERAKEFLELLGRLYTSNILLKDSELRDLLKVTTSNLRIDQKKLLFDWKSPFHLLEKGGFITDGRPQRSTSRTISTQNLENLKGREGASEAQNGSPQRSASRTISTQNSEKLKGREVVSEAQNCSPKRSASRTISTQSSEKLQSREVVSEAQNRNQQRRTIAVQGTKAKIQENAENKTLGQIIYETIANEVRKNTRNNSCPNLPLPEQNASLHHSLILANDDDYKSGKGFAHTLQDSPPLQ
jgi:site-specific DNA recombinase